MRFLSFATAAVSCFGSTSAQQYRQYDQQLLSETCRAKTTKPINIAIIGAGASGSSAAYSLSQYAAAANLSVNITIFERSATIGGRSTTVNAYNDVTQPVELGASIFVEVNQILRIAVDEFNLSTASPHISQGYDDDDDAPIPGAALAVWDGTQFVFTQTGGSGGTWWWDAAKLLWRYGLAPIKAMRLMRTVVGKFLSIYDAPHFPFASLSQVAQDVGLLAVTAATGEQFLAEKGISGLFGPEIVQASTRVNYAQNLKFIHGLETMVCLAAENAMAVQGGNWRIFDAMVKASSATALLDTSVKGWEKNGKDGRYHVHYTGPNSSSSASGEQTTEIQESTQPFDAIILAAPLQFANLTISPALAHTPDTIPYVELHVTLFTSAHLLSPAFFQLPPDAAVPQVILTTLSDSDEPPQQGSAGVGKAGFFSISLLRSLSHPTTGKREYLYKIFSPAPPNNTFLAALLGIAPSPLPSSEAGVDSDETAGLSQIGISWLHRKKWFSYPYELPRVTFEEIKLDEKVWYTSGIESFISTMETSALMGKNVARLVVDEILSGREGERLCVD